MTTILPHIALDIGNSPRHSIIWLHGLGADGEDFVPLAEQMKLPAAMHYVFPHAPKQPVTINGGFVMRAWYDIVDMDIGAAQDEAGIRASHQAVEKIIEHEKQRGIPSSRIFLAGFSQGGAIALHTGLRQAEPLGGILALSTYLPLADMLPSEISPAARTIPIFMAHGRYDPIVSFELGNLSKERLHRLGCPVEWHEYGMQHAVCQEEVDDIERWLTTRLSA